MVEKVFNLIKQGKTINEICTTLHISHIELNRILKTIKNNGYNLYNTYYSDGSTIVKLNKGVYQPIPNKIRLAIKDKILKSIVISDLHIGSAYERPELLKIVYDYAIKHDIHIIFNTGDVIDNVYPDSDQQLIDDTVDKQVEKLLRIYPFNPSILNFILYGNHDYKSLKEDGFDIARYVELQRPDLISCGYGGCEILLKDDRVGLIHDLKTKKQKNIPIDTTITFKGHSHKSKNSYKDNKVIYVPSLSEDMTNAYEFKPLVCFLEVIIKFYEKKIERINIRQLAIVDEEIRLANEEAIVLKNIPHHQ